MHRFINGQFIWNLVRVIVFRLKIEFDKFTIDQLSILFCIDRFASNVVIVYVLPIFIPTSLSMMF